jgi:CubicO group peptidase (beta-lactamase class C family)
MQKNIWSKLGATSTTFHPELHPETLPRKLGMANRVSIGQGAKSVKAGPIILGQPLKDDLGGIGLWSTPNDFVKLLTALLKGGQPLLTKASVDTLFRPQLSNASRAAMPRPLGGQMRRVLGIKSVDEIDQADHCLAGTITLRDIPGRRPSGTVNWSGLPNLHWVRLSSYLFHTS